MKQRQQRKKIAPCIATNNFVDMFAAAKWENDVPEDEFNFSQVKKKNKMKEAINKTEKGSSSTKAKKRRNTKFNKTCLTEYNIEKKCTQKNVSTKNIRSSETQHLLTQSELLEYKNDNNKYPQKSKTKRHKNTSNNLLNDDLDETIIANKKREILNAFDPTESMLFHSIKVNENKQKKKEQNNELNETIAKKKNQLFNPVKTTDNHSYETVIAKKKKEVPVKVMTVGSYENITSKKKKDNFNPELNSVLPKVNGKEEKIKNKLKTHLRNSIKTSGASLVNENEQNKSSAINSTTEKAYYCTKINKKIDKKINNVPTTQNIQKTLTQKNESIKEMRCSKRQHLSTETKLSHDNDNKYEPQKKKKKINKNKSNLMNAELNETFANKKKDSWIPVKLMNVELSETIPAKKKKGIFNSEKATEVVSVPLKLNRKKEKIENILQGHVRRSIKTSGAALNQRMLEKLKGAQFRYLNEKMYVSEGKDAKDLFKNDPTSFKVYHEGFRQQVKKWPVNPLDIIIENISKMPKTTKVADLGCGEGTLAKSVPQKVRSFDLVAMTEEVEECDMARTPLLTGEMDVAVYCLALMGTNLKQYLIEANRILKVEGLMKIAEVESRFSDVNQFIKGVESYGFKLAKVDDTHKVFYFFDFKKVRDLGSKKNKLPFITLEPCLYKRR